MSVLYQELMGAEWRMLDDLARIDTLTAELLALVREHDVHVEQWPEDLERLAHLVLHGEEGDR